MAVDGRIRALWILHYATIFGGADRFVLKLARHAISSGHSVRFLCEPASELADRCRSEGIEVVAVRYPDFLPPPMVRAPATLRRLHRLLRSAPPGTALIASGPRPQAYSAWSLPGVRLVHLAHEQDTATRRSARLLLPRTGAVVAVGSNSASAYGRALGVPVLAVNNILDRNDLEQAGASRPERLPSGAPRLGALVRFIPEKGVVELVDELARWPDSWAELQVGALPQDPDYARAVAGRIAASGLDARVRLVGPVADLHAFFRQIDMLVVPSIGKEGQPTTILEALAHGAGVVVRRPVWSEDYAGLPVSAYRAAEDFGPAVTELAGVPAAPLDELARRFGPEQALEGILRAASAVRAAA